MDLLAAEAQALEDAFYHQDQFNPAAWHALATAFEKADRIERAAHTVEKLRRLQSITPSP